MKKTTHYFATACIECREVIFGFGDVTLLEVAYDYECDSCGAATTILYETTDKEESLLKTEAIQLWQESNPVIDMSVEGN